MEKQHLVCTCGHERPAKHQNFALLDPMDSLDKKFTLNQTPNVAHGTGLSPEAFETWYHMYKDYILMQKVLGSNSEETFHVQ